jgi:hypothetical protein
MEKEFYTKKEFEIDVDVTAYNSETGAGWKRIDNVALGYVNPSVSGASLQTLLSIGYIRAWRLKDIFVLNGSASGAGDQIRVGRFFAHTADTPSIPTFGEISLQMNMNEGGAEIPESSTSNQMNTAEIWILTNFTGSIKLRIGLLLDVIENF